MKPIKITEEGFLLNNKNATQLRNNLLGNVRTSLNCLVRIGTITHKERNSIEFYIDKFVYLDELKGGLKEE